MSNVFFTRRTNWIVSSGTNGARFGRSDLLPTIHVLTLNSSNKNFFMVGLVPWKLDFEGSRTEHGVGAGIVIESPSGLVTQFAFQLEGVCSNNRAEYEALIIILKEVDVSTIEIIGDSQLVINHIAVFFPVSPVDAYLASSV